MLYYFRINRFTINSFNHDHYNDNDRVAHRDDGVTANNNSWLRSAGRGYEQDALFRPVASVWHTGLRPAGIANSTFFGFRPSLY